MSKALVSVLHIHQKRREREDNLDEKQRIEDPTLCGGNDLVESLEVCDEVSVRLQELDVCAISVCTIKMHGQRCSTLVRSRGEACKRTVGACPRSLAACTLLS